MAVTIITFQVVHSDGTPVPSQQVILRTLGDMQYGITDYYGYVTIPTRDDSGNVIIQGRTRHCGYLLDLTQVVLN
ncbi:MAG: hypothetical protein SF052_14060 [Bacteroidia bacterium]|nr:hypothetical protein [Bacteroidia bacterium]